MAPLDTIRMQATIPAVAEEFIGEARELQRVGREYIIPFISSLRGYGGTEAYPRIEPDRLGQGYLNLLFVQLYHLIEQQISL